MIREGSDLSWLAEVKRTARDIEDDYRMDIALSVSEQMRRLGMGQNDLARSMGIGQAQVSRIVTGKQNLTIRTLARLEEALGLHLGSGFRRYQTLIEEPERMECALEGQGTNGWASCTGQPTTGHRLPTDGRSWMEGCGRAGGARDRHDLRLVNGVAA